VSRPQSRASTPASFPNIAPIIISSGDSDDDFLPRITVKSEPAAAGAQKGEDKGAAKGAAKTTEITPNLVL
jgi:hypothetical protein